MFLSYQTAPQRRAGKLEYVLEEFEIAPLPVQVVYPYTRLMSTRVRAFLNVCVEQLRQVSFD